MQEELFQIPISAKISFSINFSRCCHNIIKDIIGEQ